MLPRRGQLLRTDSTKLALGDDGDISVGGAIRPFVQREGRPIVCNIVEKVLMRWHS